MLSSLSSSREVPKQLSSDNNNEQSYIALKKLTTQKQLQQNFMTINKRQKSLDEKKSLHSAYNTPSICLTQSTNAITTTTIVTTTTNNSLSNKSVIKNNNKKSWNSVPDKPNKIRIAWSSIDKLNIHSDSSIVPEVIASRIGELSSQSSINKRISLSSASSQVGPTSLLDSNNDKATILYSKEELAERLRVAWKQREANKSNIDIFLAHETTATNNNCDDEFSSERCDSKLSIENYDTATEDNNNSLSLPLSTSIKIKDNNYHVKENEEKKTVKSHHTTDAKLKRASFQSGTNLAFITSTSTSSRPTGSSDKNIICISPTSTLSLSSLSSSSSSTSTSAVIIKSSEKKFDKSERRLNKSCDNVPTAISTPIILDINKTKTRISNSAPPLQRNNRRTPAAPPVRRPRASPSITMEYPPTGAVTISSAYAKPKVNIIIDTPKIGTVTNNQSKNKIVKRDINFTSNSFNNFSMENSDQGLTAATHCYYSSSCPSLSSPNLPNHSAPNSATVKPISTNNNNKTLLKTSNSASFNKKRIRASSSSKNSTSGSKRRGGGGVMGVDVLEKKKNECRSNNHSDIITMVSLISSDDGDSDSEIDKNLSNEINQEKLVQQFKNNLIPLNQTLPIPIIKNNSALSANTSSILMTSSTRNLGNVILPNKNYCDNDDNNNDDDNSCTPLAIPQRRIFKSVSFQQDSLINIEKLEDNKKNCIYCMNDGLTKTTLQRCQQHQAVNSSIINRNNDELKDKPLNYCDNTIKSENSTVTSIIIPSSNIPLSSNYWNNYQSDNESLASSLVLTDREKRCLVIPVGDPKDNKKIKKTFLLQKSKSMPSDITYDEVENSQHYQLSMQIDAINKSKDDKLFISSATVKSINSEVVNQQSSLNNSNEREPPPGVNQHFLISKVCNQIIKSSSLDKSSTEVEPPIVVNDDTDAIQSSLNNTNQQYHLKTTKEKECWHLYRKMCDKGVCVSFDTVLRGMLTPTEYRLRRRKVTT